MIKKEIYIIFLFFLWFSSYSQSNNDSLAVTFHLEFNKLPLELTKQYVSASNDSLSIENFRCYISNLKIQYSYHLLDAENPNSFRIPITNKGAKLISRITFSIGIDSVTSNSAALSGDLDPIKGMYWAWQSGYINMKIDGKSPSCQTRKNKFEFHIGGYLQPYYAMRELKFDLDNKADGNIDIGIDLYRFLSHLELKQTNSVMIPGKEAMKLADYSTEMFYIR
jgi:hypothetical protein